MNFKSNNVPNYFAYFALVAWFFVSVQFFKTKKIELAILLTIIGGYLALPVKVVIQLPVVPLNKDNICCIAALIGFCIMKKQKIKVFGQTPLINFFALLLIISPFLTALSNTESLWIGNKAIQGLTLYDGLLTSINQCIYVLVPFVLGRTLFDHYSQQLLLFRFLVGAGLIYSLPMLLEIRISPQLHTWIYGFFPHSFLQQFRKDGFRPVVFLGHGLLVAFFASITVLCAATLIDLKEKIRKFKPSNTLYYLIAVLVMCKSMGALIYGVIATASIRFTSFNLQLLTAKIIAIISVSYPLLCILNLFPHAMILDWAYSSDAERGESLQFRFDNEIRLLNHAKEKIWFGWGSWGRNRVYSQETGEDESITDGEWIITFGQFGWVGYIAQRGLLMLPVFLTSQTLKKTKSNQEKILLVAHALLLSIISVDQIPNSSLSPMTWLIAGGLLGRIELVKSKKPLEPVEHNMKM